MDNGELRMRKASPAGPSLEFVLLERLEGGGAGAQGVVFRDSIEDVNAAIMQQRGLRDRPLRRVRADGAAFERFVGNLLYGFEAVAFCAFVFIEWHDKVGTTHALSSQRDIRS